MSLKKLFTMILTCTLVLSSIPVYANDIEEEPIPLSEEDISDDDSVTPPGDDFVDVEGNSEDSSSDEEKKDSDEDSSSGEETYLGNFKLTAYCNCAKCCGRAGAPTASGTTPCEGRTVAMGGIPFGTKLRINGTVYTVEDRGTPYGTVDIFMSDHQSCLNFGVQYADVYQVG